MLNVLYFYFALPAVCVQCPMWLFYVVLCFGTFPACSSGMSWMILRWLQLPLLLFYHVCFYSLHALTYYFKVCIHILEYSRLLSWSNFYLVNLYHLETYMFLFHCHGLWSPVYCYVVLSFFTCWFHNTYTLLWWLCSTDFGIYILILLFLI